MEALENFFTEEIATSVIEGSASEEIKSIIESVYKKVFRKNVAYSCKQCFTDAFFEAYNLWKTNNELFNKLFICEYALKYGVVLSIFGDTETMAVRTNLTNELAEFHLRSNPNCIIEFESYPSDYLDRLEVEPVEPVQELPLDIPERQLLIDNDLTTIELVKAFGDLTKISGIGVAKATLIYDYLAS